MIVKNTFGCSAVLSSNQFKNKPCPRYSGSSLDRKKKVKKEISEFKVEEISEKVSPEKSSEVNPSEEVEEVSHQVYKELKVRVMSSRTKSKIRKKLLAFSQLHKNLTFVTLTFVNEVTDQKAVKVLGKFIDNYKKRLKNFQYLWVAERQTLNKTFQDNIHFHMITNQYWKIEKTWEYWIALQAKEGILPRDLNFKPSSAFDVKKISTSNSKQVGAYLTKYVTKNKSEFTCQVWNCSKNISALYTDFYTDYRFIEQLKKLKGDEIKEVPLEYCTLHFIPLDKTTMRFYDRLENKNRQTQKLLN